MVEGDGLGKWSARRRNMNKIRNQSVKRRTHHND